MDFVNAAWKSNGGESFLCLSSSYRDRDGVLKSRIMPMLPEGSIVTTPRTLVDHIVTEYGIADVRGKPEKEVIMELIKIADLVTDMSEVKHYFHKGISSRNGIDH